MYKKVKQKTRLILVVSVLILIFETVSPNMIGCLLTESYKSMLKLLFFKIKSQADDVAIPASYEYGCRTPF